MAQTERQADPITPAIVSALADGLPANAAAQLHRNAYGKLKAAIAATFGLESDLMRAIEGLEAKPASAGRRATLQEEVAAARADQHPAIRGLALDLLRQFTDGNQTQPVQSAAEPEAVAPVSRYQLPPDSEDFTDREDDVARLTGLLQSNGQASGAICAIAGMPGVGKSALAIHVAHQLKDHFPDVRFYVDMRTTEGSPAGIASALAGLLHDLDVQEDGAPRELPEQVRLYRSVLRDKRALILLDNVSDEEQVRPLLPGSSTCAVLVTARKYLTAIEGMTVLNLEVMSDAQALQLLERLIGASRVRDEPQAARTIVTLCGGLPLALHITGINLRNRPQWTLEQEATALAQERLRLQRLRSGDLDVSAAIAQSYRLLAEPEARLFRLLALLPGPDYTEGVAAALLGVDPAEAQESLSRLAEAQLVERRDGEGYHVQELVRLFAAGRLDEEDPLEVQQAAWVRVGGWYLEALKRLGQWLRTGTPSALSADQAQGVDAPPEALARDGFATALAWFERERQNLLATVEGINRVGAWDLVWRFVANLSDFFQARALWADMEWSNDIALAAVRKIGDRSGEAVTLNNLGIVYVARGRWGEALVCFEWSLAICLELGDRWGEGQMLGNLGNVYREQGRWEQASACLEQSLGIKRELGDRRGEGMTLNNLGVVYQALGRWDEAIACFEQSLDIACEAGDRRGEGRTLGNLGIVYGEQGRWDEAIACYAQSIAAAHEVADRDTEGKALENLGDVYRSLGDQDAATSSYQDALAIVAALHGSAHPAVKRIVGKIGEVARERADGERAAALPQRSLATARRFLEQAGVKLHRQDERSLVITELQGSLGPFVPVAVAVAADAPHEQDVAALVERSASQARDGHDGAERAAILLYAEPPDALVRMTIARARLHDRVSIIPIPLAAVERASLDAATSAGLLTEYVDRYLPRADLFDDRNAIGDTLSFFGRTELLHRLETDLPKRQGIGLFGLRKAGKTSVLLQLDYVLRRHPVIRIDLESYGGNSLYGAELFNDVLRKLAALGNGRAPGLDWHVEPLLRNVPAATVAPAFVRGVSALAERLREAGYEPPILCFLDEIERVLPHRMDAREKVAEFNACFGALRGLSQNEGVLTLLVADVHPDCNRVNQWSQEGMPTNPVYSFFKEIFIAPFSVDETVAMLADIGQLMGRSFDDDVLADVHHLSGGHPFVARQLASLLCARIAVQECEPITRPAARRYLEEPLTYSSVLRDYFGQNIWADLEKRRAMATMAVLRVLASIPDDEWVTEQQLWRRLRVSFTRNQFLEALQWLGDCGLVWREEARGGDRCRIRVPLLRQWLHMEMSDEELRQWQAR